MNESCGIVVIGRNEGERLLRCLQSLGDYPVVYVDSGSSDDSVAQSKKRGVSVVELDMSLPFTAARARNAGAEKLVAEHPNIEFIQFMDGDCQIAKGWLERAQKEMKSDPSLAAVCGRRREVDRGASVYNMLCDIEWDTPVGTADACGGDAMYRVAAFRAAGRFNEEFIAGEEPELCYRLRRAGWWIKRVDQDMTQHDAAMYSFKQWWKRSQRSGYAYALGALEHGTEPDRYKVKPCLSIVVWGAVLPFIILMLLFIRWPAALVLFCGAYLYLGTRIYASSRARHPEFSRRQMMIYSAFLVLQKIPEFVGVLRCFWQQLNGHKMNIIEYK